MPIQFRCSNCGQKLSISRKKAGTDVTCPECVQRIRVPTIEEAIARAKQRQLEKEKLLAQQAAHSKPAAPQATKPPVKRREELPSEAKAPPKEKPPEQKQLAPPTVETPPPVVPPVVSEKKPLREDLPSEANAKATPPVVERKPQPPVEEPLVEEVDELEELDQIEDLPPNLDDLFEDVVEKEVVENKIVAETPSVDESKIDQSNNLSDVDAEYEETSSSTATTTDDDFAKPQTWQHHPNPWLHEDEDDDDFQLAPVALEESGLDMTPMVDVTFLLLIFFMVTASFSTQKSLETAPPEPDEEGAAAAVVLDDIEEESVIVEIDEEDNIRVDDIPVSGFGELKDVLQAKIGEGKTEMLIEANAKSRHGTVVAVTDAGIDVQMQRIRRSSKKGDD